MAKPTVVKQEGINPLGIIVALLIFCLAGLGIVHSASKQTATKMPDIQPKNAAQAHTPQNIDLSTPASEDPQARINIDKKINIRNVESRTERKTQKKKINNYPDRTFVVEQKAERKKAVVPATVSSASVIKIEPTQPKPRLVTANELNNLESAKAATSVQKIDTKSIGGKAIPWYSVRVGYTDSKVRADILRDVLAQQGFVKAETKKSDDGNYYVSLGDYMFRYQAEDLASTIREKTAMEPQIQEKTVAK